jgi:cellulose synthase operon protein C
MSGRRVHPVLSLVPLAALMACLAAGLAGCAGPQRFAGDNQPTLASLPTNGPQVASDGKRVPNEELAIKGYRQFLQAVPNAPQRADALRRLGDLEMDRADRLAGDDTLGDKAPSASTLPDYKAAIVQYREFLTNYPNDPRNDRVLYQLARAQEQGGDLESALQTLTRLVTRYPGTLYADEAHFRQGELLFTFGKYKAAEAAYTQVLRSDQRTPFHERALFMQGWSLFKQGRLDESLKPFFAVLDIKLGGLNARERDEADLAEVRALKRADRELVDDTFRVVSISLANLQGQDSVPPLINSRVREGYQFRVYQKLAELYLKQQRVKDAADTYAAYVKRDPLAAQAPLLQARVIEIYEDGGLPSLALQAKKDQVLTYGAKSDFRRTNPRGWDGAQPVLKQHLMDLARDAHARAQKTKARADVDEAVRWYRLLLEDYDADDNTPAQRYLLAELFFENQRWESAAAEFELVAYGDKKRNRPDATRGADAGYFALLAYAEQDKAAPNVTARNALQTQSINSALRFGEAFAQDPRTGAVLTRAAEQLFASGQGERASNVARQALAAVPAAEPVVRRTAWNVVALQAFDKGEFDVAEKASAEVLALASAGTALGAAARAEVAERQAAAIYKQGEQARNSGQARAAVGYFDRIAAMGAAGTLPTGSAVRASAQYDAAASLIALKDWDAAARALEDFRRQQPNHPLQAEVPAKLALAYLELGRAGPAAAELERVAAASKDPAVARAGWWQAAELFDKNSDKAPARSPQLASAIKAYERYQQLYPQPLENAVVARARLAALSQQDGQPTKALAWSQAVLQSDAAGGAQRTARTRSLAALAALRLTEPLAEAYRRVALVEPLQKQLALKKNKLEELQKVYAQATEIAAGGSAEVTTMATFLTASLYQDFGQALLKSERPKKLKKAELEQYNVLLEEQAFPFEEKAITLHENNARRTASGLFDASIKNSLTELAKLKPVRYAKTERSDSALPLDVAALQNTLQANPRQAGVFNQLGVAQRQQGQFEDARRSYETAITLAPNAPAPQLNLAILYDLYLNQPTRAVPLYQRCVELLPADATLINRWLAELKARKPAPTDAKEAL